MHLITTYELRGSSRTGHRNLQHFLFFSALRSGYYNHILLPNHSKNTVILEGDPPTLSSANSK